jgi:hypothetical protein
MHSGNSTRKRRKGDERDTFAHAYIGREFKGSRLVGRLVIASLHTTILLLSCAMSRKLLLVSVQSELDNLTRPKGCPVDGLGHGRPSLQTGECMSRCLRRVFQDIRATTGVRQLLSSVELRRWGFREDGRGPRVSRNIDSRLKILASPFS